MTAGIQQWVGKVLAAVQQQHDMEDVRNLVLLRCSRAGMKAALDHCLSDVDTLQVRQSTILSICLLREVLAICSCTLPTDLPQMQALLSALLLACRPQPLDSAEHLHQCGKHRLTVVVSSILFLAKLEKAASPAADRVVAICSKQLGNFGRELLPTVSPCCIPVSCLGEVVPKLPAKGGFCQQQRLSSAA